jgi:CBS domain-containing protein
MYVQETMTPHPASCTIRTSLAEVARMMVEFDCGEIPVVDDIDEGRPIGVVTDRDIVVRTLACDINPLEMRAGDVMTTPVVTVAQEMPLQACCDLMEKHQIRRVLVVDERGCLCGIVAVADLSRSVGRATTGEIIREVSEAA